MGIFNFIARALGPVSDEELKRQREAVRRRYVSAENVGEASRLFSVLHRYDEEMSRRANKAYARENPNPPKPRHRAHGWYLPNDD